MADAAQLLAAQDAAARVRATEPLRDYIVKLLWRTREDPRVDLGASPRAGLMLLRAAKAYALVRGRDHALPDDVQSLAGAGARASTGHGAGRLTIDSRGRRGRRSRLRARAVTRAVGIVAAGGLLILVAFTFGTSELLVPGIGFGLLGVGTASWMLAAAAAASVRRSIEDDRVVEDQPLEVRIEVRGGPLGLPGAEVVDSLAGTTVRLSGAPGRLAARSTEVRVVGRFPRRGRHRLQAPTLVLRDALGLVRIMRRSRIGVQTVLVLPRTERLRWLGSPEASRIDPRSGPAQLEMLAALEVDGLRAVPAGNSGLTYQLGRAGPRGAGCSSAASGTSATRGRW